VKHPGSRRETPQKYLLRVKLSGKTSPTKAEATMPTNCTCRSRTGQSRVRVGNSRVLLRSIQLGVLSRCRLCRFFTCVALKSTQAGSEVRGKLWRRPRVTTTAQRCCPLPRVFLIGRNPIVHRAGAKHHRKMCVTPRRGETPPEKMRNTRSVRNTTGNQNTLLSGRKRPGGVKHAGKMCETPREQAG
jgi:hypothetical protein